MVDDMKIKIYSPGMRGKWENFKNGLAICILSCYNDGVKR